MNLIRLSFLNLSYNLTIHIVINNRKKIENHGLEGQFFSQFVPFEQNFKIIYGAYEHFQFFRVSNCIKAFIGVILTLDYVKTNMGPF